MPPRVVAQLRPRHMLQQGPEHRQLSASIGATKLPRRAGAGALAQLPYTVVLLIAAAGIWWAWRGSHDVGNGAGVVGGALLAAAIARLALPRTAAGLLASRRRFADVLALGAFGTGLLVLALVLPPT